MKILFKNGVMTCNGLIVMFDGPGRLYDRDGKDITGAVVEADLDKGLVTYKTHYIGRFNLITGKDTRTTRHAPPLKLVDALGRSWQGKSQA